MRRSEFNPDKLTSVSGNMENVSIQVFTNVFRIEIGSKHERRMCSCRCK